MKRSAKALMLADSGGSSFTFPRSLRMISLKAPASKSCHHFVTNKKKAP